MKKRKGIIGCLLAISLAIGGWTTPLTPVKAATQDLITPGSSKETAQQLDTRENGVYALRTESKDGDWYKFQTPTYAAYTILTFRNNNMTRSEINVWDAIDAQLYSDDYWYSNEDSTLNMKLIPNQVYYIRISEGTTGGTYTINLHFEADAQGNTKEEAYEIPMNVEHTWSIDGNDDKDYATFTAGKSGKYLISLNNTGNGSRMYIYVYDYATDQELWYDDYVYNGEVGERVFDLEAGHRYYFVIGGGSSGKYTIQVNNQTVEAIQLSEKSIKLAKGNNTTLAAQIAPSGAYNKNVTWGSNDSDIATVDQNGTIVGKNPGSTLITCSAQDGSNVVASCKVIVLPEKIYDVYGDSYQASSKSVYVKWSSQNNVDGYTIYVYDSSKKAYRAVKTVKNNVNYAKVTTTVSNGKSTKIAAGKVYKYKVAAYVTIDGQKYYGPMSDAMTSGTAPAAPVVKTVKNYRNGNVRITWNKSANASGYVIYRVDNSGYVSQVDTVIGGKRTSYTYNPWLSGRYTYKVAAYRLINGNKYVGEKGKGKAVNIKY